MEGGLQPGTVLLEKYRVESVLGRGGMGVVLRVTHLHLGEELAIKILSPDAGGGPEVHARFLREAQSAVRLKGEHVARVGDVGVLPGGAPYMVMEYLRGADLSGELARRVVLPPGEIVDYVLQACEALAEAHAFGIVHRDIKPSNLFLTRRPDGSPLVKVLDFGISKVPLGGPGVLTRTDAVMGTPGYMSPEQMKASKDVDARSDIWALGIVLYECLNGRRPFDAETFSATVLRAATEPLPPMDPRLPRGLQAVIVRCLEKDRAARFPSVAALAAALAPFARDARSAGIIIERTAAMLQGPSASAAQVPRVDPPRQATTLSGSAGMMRSRSTRRYAVGGAAVALAAIIAVSIVGLTAQRRDQEATGSEGSVAVGRPPGGGSDGSAAISATGGPHGAGPVRDAVEVARAIPLDAAVAADPKGARPPGSDVKAKAAQCVEFEGNRKWQELMDCTTDLTSLAAQDRSLAGKVDALRQKAIRETANSLAAGKVKDAIAGGNLREALQQLKTIGYSSVYFLDTSTSFRAAEARAVDDNRRKAQVLAAANDCAGVKRLEAQVDASGTPAIVGAVATVAANCMARAPPINAAPAPSGHQAPAAQARGSSSPINATSAPSGHQTPAVQVRGSSPPTNAAPAPSGDQARAATSTPSCETMNIDDMMTQANNQYVAGFAKAALSLVVKALACRQNDRMYRMAVTYACVAHDAAAAKAYYGKLSPQFRPPLTQRCQQENVAIP